MNSFLAKIFLWFTSLVFFVNIVLAGNATIIKPDSLYISDVNFFNEEGGKIFLDQFEGKTILVCFWASWCGTCVDELPNLDLLQKDFRKLPFEIVAISEDFNGIKAAREHFDKYGIRHLKLYHDYKNALFNEMKVVGLPTAFVIDPSGKIKIIFKGEFKWYDDTIREILLSEIPGNQPMPKNSYIHRSLNKTNNQLKDNSSSQSKTKESKNENDKQN